jgi:hypothetical protein
LDLKLKFLILLKGICKFHSVDILNIDLLSQKKKSSSLIFMHVRLRLEPYI